MITLLEAQAIATSHAKSQGKIRPGLYYNIKDGREYSQCYYFDYYIADEHGNTSNQQFGGAPGIAVDKKSGEVSVMTFGKLAELK